MTVSLFNEKALRERAYKLYSGMKARCRPRLWKSGRRAGKVRIPGFELSFTKEQLWAHMLREVGTGCIRCPYCEMIGRPANPIDLTNCVLDHVVPVARGGTWTLDNLRCVCSDCNNLKGKLTLEFFVALMSAVEKWQDPYDRASFHACLRTHGVALQAQRFARSKPAPQDHIPETAPLALQEDF